MLRHGEKVLQIVVMVNWSSKDIACVHIKLRPCTVLSKYLSFGYSQTVQTAKSCVSKNFQFLSY